MKRVNKANKKRLLSVVCALTLAAGLFGGIGGKSMEVVNAAGEPTITFLGGSLRVPGDYELKGTSSEKEAAVSKAQLRFGYRITVPQGKTLSDYNWSWSWYLSDPSSSRQVNGVNYIKEDSNTYRTNLVITGIPMNTDYLTDIHSVFTVSAKQDASVTVTDEAQIRSVQTVTEMIKGAIDNGTSSENETIQDYVNCLTAVKCQKAGTLWDTGSSAALGNHRSSVNWLSEYDGESGVISLEGNNQNHFLFRNSISPVFENAYYADADTLVFRMKTDDSDGSAYLQYIAETPWTYFESVQCIGEWTDVEIPLSQKGLTAETFLTTFTNQSLMYTSGIKDANAKIYIADIKLIKKAGITNALTGRQAEGKEITLNDNHAEVLSGLKNQCCYVDGPDGRTIVTDGKFTPTQAGVYLVSYIAESESGAATYGSYKIQVYASGTLWDTGSSAALGNHGSSVNWLSEYDGEKGVISLEGDDKNHFLFRSGISPVFENAYYADADTLVFRMKTDDSDGSAYLQYIAEASWTCFASVQCIGEWTDVEIPLSQKGLTAETFLTTFTNQSLMYTSGIKDANAKIYIADIKLIKKETEPQTGGGTLWDTDSEEGLGTNYTTAYVKWLSEYDGEQGVVSLSGNNINHFLFRGGVSPVHENAYYADADTLVFRMKTDDPDGIAYLQYIGYDPWTAFSAVQCTGTWMDIEIPLSQNGLTAEEFLTTFTNKNLMYPSSLSANSKIYIADIKLIKK